MAALLKKLVEGKVLRDCYIGLRLTREEKNNITLKAGLYTGGNVTAWLTYCALNYKPRITELLEEAPASRLTRAPNKRRG